MAEKHKSKYKEAKDMAKSQKIEARKDLKDYTGDEAHGMVPELVKGPQKLVPRNINGEVIEDIENMVPKIKERLYKKVEEGDYSPEHARKVFEKLQIEDTEGYLDAMENGVYDIKESVSKLSESQKEKLVRMYVRNKIAKVLQEQTPADEETPLPPPAGKTPPPTEETPPPPGEETLPQQQTTTGGSGLGAMQQSDQEFNDTMGEPDPAQEKEEKQQVLLDKIKNSPIEFSDVLNYFHESRKDEKMVTLGLKPLLDTINNIEKQSEYEAVLSMIKDEINKSRKEYRKRLLAKSQEQPEDQDEA